MNTHTEKTQSLPELMAQMEKLQSKISEVKEVAKKSTIDAVCQTIQKAGFTFEELFPTGKTKKRAKVAPKYRNPDNHEQTWTGRGRKPKWISAKLEAGEKIETFAI